MNLTTRDRVATLLVATAAFIYGAWLTGILGWLTPAQIAMVVLTLGFLASASAVVPGFVALLRGSRAYPALASFLGFGALASGILTVVNATGTTLAILVLTTLALWASATLHHATLHRRRDVVIG